MAVSGPADDHHPNSPRPCSSDDAPAPQRRRRIFGRKVRVALGLVGLVIAVGGGWLLYQRFITRNFHTVVEAKVYRSAQPTPEHLRRWASDHGIKTVINLRGNETRDPVVQEIATCRKLGLAYHCIRLPNYVHPERGKMIRLVDTIAAAEKPVLIHCRAGADRTGIISVIAAMQIGGLSYDEARPHLSWRYLHLDNNPENVGGFMKLYEDYCRDQGVSTGGWEQFNRWLREVYVGPAPKATTQPAGAPSPATRTVPG